MAVYRPHCKKKQRAIMGYTKMSSAGMTAKGQEKPLQRQEKWWPKGHQRHLAGSHQHTGSTVCKEPDRTSPGLSCFYVEDRPKVIDKRPRLHSQALWVPTLLSDCSLNAELEAHVGSSKGSPSCPASHCLSLIPYELTAWGRMWEDEAAASRATE